MHLIKHWLKIRKVFVKMPPPPLWHWCVVKLCPGIVTRDRATRRVGGGLMGEEGTKKSAGKYVSYHHSPWKENRARWKLKGRKDRGRLTAETDRVEVKMTERQLRGGAENEKWMAGREQGSIEIGTQRTSMNKRCVCVPFNVPGLKLWIK